MTNIVCDKLGIRYPILQGPMAWASDSKLAASVSNAGGLGIMGLGFCPPAVFEAEIRAARALTEAPFGLNIITCLPDADKLLEITLRQGIRVVEIETFPAYFDTLPRYVEALRSHGAATVGKASSVSWASSTCSANERPGRRIGVTAARRATRRCLHGPDRCRSERPITRHRAEKIHDDL